MKFSSEKGGRKQGTMDNGEWMMENGDFFRYGKVGIAALTRRLGLPESIYGLGF